MTAQTYADQFRILMASGMTAAEALAEFEQNEWRSALLAEIEQGGRSLLELQAKADRGAQNAEDLGQAMELWLAGWKSEQPIPGRNVDVMSLYWRRPPRRPGSKGMLFRSTQQAFNSLKRGQATP